MISHRPNMLHDVLTTWTLLDFRNVRPLHGDMCFWSSETRDEHQHAPGVHAADLMIYLRERLAEKRLAGFTRSTTYYQILGGIMCATDSVTLRRKWRATTTCTCSRGWRFSAVCSRRGWRSVSSTTHTTYDGGDEGPRLTRIPCGLHDCRLDCC